MLNTWIAVLPIGDKPNNEIKRFLSIADCALLKTITPVTIFEYACNQRLIRTLER